MTDEHAGTRRAFELFDEALQRPSGERSAWVERRTSGDPSLAAEVMSLLAAHGASGILDRSPAFPIADGLAEPTPTSAEVAARISAALADRYDDIQPLGEGGMAVVYLAREDKHDRMVVLKVLRPDVAETYGEERFLQEVRLASTLSHPHILPFLDSGRADGLLYYVMPHAPGETLQELAAREGPLAPERAGPLLRDVADALAFAHGHGVVHRDLKPANVLCVDDHAYLMDFGVAKALHPDSDDVLTRPGFSPGTPRYMAPEQWSDGREAGAAADVFAWGQVAHESLTGTLVSVEGADPRHTTERLDQLAPALPDGWSRTIARALSPDPESRPTAREVHEVMQSRRTGGAPTSADGRRRWIAAGVAGVVLAGAAFASVWRDGRSIQPPTSPGLVTPIAVAPFRNETGDPSLDFLGRLAGDWITQGVRELGEVVVPWSVSRDVLERARGDTTVDAALLLEEEVGARTVITGRFYRVGDQVSFAADVTETAGPTLLVATSPVGAPFDEAERALEELRDRIMGSVSALTGERTAGMPSLTNRAPTVDAYRSFDQGLAHYLVQEYGQATTEFRRAFERDTTFLTTLLFAAATARNQGDDAVADSLIDFLEPRRERLTRYDDLRWQFQDASRKGESQTALRALREATALAPGSRAAYNLALVANGLNRPQEALDALDTLDPDGGEIRGWAQYWTQRSHALHLLGRHREEAAAAAEMVRRHPERTVAPVLLARALGSEGRIGELEDVLTQSALRPPRTYWSHGAALTVAGEELLAHGAPERAAPLLARAEAWLDDQIRAAPDYLAHRYWKASVLYDQRRWQEAATVASLLLESAPDNTTYRGMTAVGVARTGDPTEAIDHLARDAWRGQEGDRLIYSARVHAILGDLDRAFADLAAALEQGVGGFGWTHATAHHDFELMRADERIARLLAPTTVR